MKTGDAVLLRDGRLGVVTGCNYWNPEFGPMAMVHVEDREAGFVKYELLPERQLLVQEEAEAPDFLEAFTEPKFAAAIQQLRETACQQ